jgi:hypothetical protein
MPPDSRKRCFHICDDLGYVGDSARRTPVAHADDRNYALNVVRQPASRLGASVLGRPQPTRQEPV